MAFIVLVISLKIYFLAVYHSRLVLSFIPKNYFKIAHLLNDGEFYISLNILKNKTFMSKGSREKYLLCLIYLKKLFLQIINK